MDSRERLAEALLNADRNRTGLPPIRLDECERPEVYYAQAHYLLASDWLRDTLAAERERCAKVAEQMAARRITKDMREMLGLCAKAIRNLEPEASDDRG